MASLNTKYGVGDKGDPRRDIPTPENAGETLKRLDRYERTHGRSGAIPRSPKDLILQTAKERAQASVGSDRHIRGINVASTDKAMNATIQGYEPISDSDGKPIMAGPNLQMWSCPREMYEDRVAERESLTANKLGYDDDGRRRDSPEFYQQAEGIARMARDRGHATGQRVERIVKSDIPTELGG